MHPFHNTQEAFQKKLQHCQKYLSENGLDGWLLYDFRNHNTLAAKFLEIPPSTMLTRRFYYWIPSQGNPLKLVHAIEAKNLDHLPGERRVYSTWQTMQEMLKTLLAGKKTILMEYSKNNAIPYLSKVDGGSLELIRSCGVEVESSGNLLQHYTSVWTEGKYADHVAVANVLCEAVEDVWRWIALRLKEGEAVDEYQAQQRILKTIASSGCETEEPPIVAVNAHSADPHYLPDAGRFSPIKPGDFILIDLFCRKNQPEAPYADITRVAVAAPKPNPKQEKIFEIVKTAQQAALTLIQERFREHAPLMGWEVDQACRDVIEKAGYGRYFIHRTGHNLDIELHGPGANMDNFETRDERRILPGTCFTIEPGIYLPGEFGVRLESDVFVRSNGQVEVNGGMQEKIECL